MELSELLRTSAGRVPSKPALIVASDERVVTYAELDADVDRVAAGLQDLGVTRGERVALALPNSVAFVVAYLGILRSGGVVVPLNIALAEPEVRSILEDATPRAIVTDADREPAMKAAAGSPPLVEHVVVADSWSDLAPQGASPRAAAVGEDDLAVLAYTSGTTGAPKGAMLSHGNLLSNLRQQMAIPEDTVREDDVMLLTLPMFHIFGLNVPLGLLVMNGATGVIVDRFEPVEALRLIGRYKVSVMFGAPPMFGALVNTPGADAYDISSVRLAISGAAPLSEEVLKSFRDIFGVDIYEGYGMTETSPTLTTNRMAAEPRPASVGKPLPDVEIRIVDEEGNDVEIGDPGEILVRGPNVFKGYWNRPEETEAVFIDGWLRTGDVAVRDEEGYIYLVDRKRDLIIVSGFNVFPSEVEAALLQDPRIADAAVVGETHPYTGESVKAYVVLADGAQATESELKDAIATRLARFKCPNSIEIVDSLPHLMTGKVLRRALRT
jgi:long-chain acyl-CoA synthetase